MGTAKRPAVVRATPFRSAASMCIVQVKSNPSRFILNYPVLCLGVCIIITIAKLWLVEGQTLFAIGGADHDERLFLNLASNLLKGDWLGQYNRLTLIKGCFYPIWIALAFVSGVPLLLAQHLLYVSACSLLVVALSSRLKSPAILALIYLILLFNPMEYGILRVLREGIYPALTLLVIAGALGIVFRWDRPLRCLLRWSMLLGCALSAFLLTREEGVWIAPAVLMFVGLAAHRIWKTPMPGRMLRLLLCCILPFGVCGAALSVVSAMNWFHYGVFTTVESKSREFLAAYGALTRVKHANWSASVPVPREARFRIYSASPVFGELEPFLEGDIGNAWAMVEGGGEDIRGGWFMWALRDAVEAAGHCSSGAAEASYYRSLAKDVNSACSEGRLECGPQRASLMPPFRAEYVRPLAGAFLSGVTYLVGFRDFDPHPPKSLGDDDLLVLFRDLTRERLSPATSGIVRYTGWVFRPSSPVRLSVWTSDEVPANARITNKPSPDVRQMLQAEGIDTTYAHRARFEITAHDCGPACFLQVETYDGQLIKRISLNDGVTSLKGPELYFKLDSRTEANVLPQQERLDSFKIGVLSLIGKTYQTLAPALLILALAIYAITLLDVLRTGKSAATFLINTALLLTILGRVFILALIEATSFNAISVIYFSAAYPLLLLFILMAPIDLLGRLQAPVAERNKILSRIEIRFALIVILLMLYLSSAGVSPKLLDRYLLNNNFQIPPNPQSDFNAAAYYNRGVANCKLGEYARAIPYFDRAIEINPEYADAYKDRGAAYGKLRNYNQAISDFDSSVKINPAYAIAYYDRGVVYDILGNNSQAISDFDRAIEINPEYSDAYYNRGFAHDRLGEHTQAISDFDRAIEINPEYADAYNSRGLTYGQLGDHRQAISDFDRAIEINPEYSMAYYNRAVVYGMLGDHSHEIEDLQKAAGLASQNAKK